MDRTQKAAFVATMNAEFKTASSVVVAHYKGLTVKEISDLRRKVRASGATFKVTKNRLTQRALQGTAFENLSDLFKGPTAVAYANDEVAAAKAIVEFAKGNEKLQVLGGSLDGKKLSVSEVKALATMPSLDELRAKIIGLLNAPATKLVRVLQAPAGQVARVVGAYSKKEG